MTQIVPFADGANVPAYLKKASAATAINDEIQTGAAYPHISIKGKAFAIVKDGERKLLMKPNEPDEVAQSIGVVIVRANNRARTYYAEQYSGDDSDGAMPTCYSLDGISPAPDAAEPQADKCQLCPHAVFGTKQRSDGTFGKGSACSQNARLAVVTPNDPDTPYLLRVPPKSLKAFREVVRTAKTRDVPYNALVVKVGFEPEEASPVLTMRPVGFVPEDMYAKVAAAYDSDMVQEIVGAVTSSAPSAPAAPAAQVAPPEEAPAKATGKPATKRAPRKPAAKPAPAPVEDDAADIAGFEATPAEYTATEAAREEPAPKPAAKPAPASDGGDALIDELNALLGGFDD